MNQARMGLLLAAALLAVPGTASAQGKAGKKPPAGAKGGKGGAPAEAPPAEAPPPPTAEKPADPPAAAEGDKKPDAPAEPDETKGICELDPAQCPKDIDTEGAAKRPIVAQMYAVQQIYALRVRRFEINP